MFSKMQKLEQQLRLGTDRQDRLGSGTFLVSDIAETNTFGSEVEVSWRPLTYRKS